MSGAATLALSLAVCFWYHGDCRAANFYRLTDLGDLPGGDNTSKAYGLNDLGQVVGETNIGGVRAYLWSRHSGMRMLDILPGRTSSIAYDINNKGQVVGDGFIYDEANGMQALSGGGIAYSINDGGTAVGLQSRATLWRADGAAVDLGAFPGNGGSEAYGVNNAGQVVGISTSKPDRAVLWDASAIHDLGRLPLPHDGNPTARAINSIGHVVGSSGTRAFLWSPAGGMQNLGLLPGDDFDGSHAFDINDAGEIVGTSQGHGSIGFHRAFVWDAVNGMRDLNNLLDASGAGWRLEEARAINRFGQIIANGWGPDGAGGFGPYHGVLLTPDDFPGPRVLSAAVGGLTWPGGYSIPDGSANQFAPLPWTRINQISLVFDKAVNLDPDALTLMGNDGTMYPLFGPFTGNGPEPGTFKATWMLESPLGLGVYTLRLNDSTTDPDGNRLDGEWVDGASALSGDGAGGGDFAFRFRVLPGDVNQDGAVNILDWAEVRDRSGATSASPNWSVFHDIDRRGSVDQVDFDTVPRTAFTFLPPFPAAGPSDAAAVPEPSTGLLLAVAFAAGFLLWRGPSARSKSLPPLCRWQFRSRVK